MVTVVSNGEELSKAFAADGLKLVVVYFWAEFHEACKEGGQLDQVTTALASKYGSKVSFVKADAEATSDVAESFDVTMVPSFVFVKGGKKLDMLEGAKPKELMELVEKHLSSSSANGSEASARNDEALNKRLKSLINSSKVMLFMKGSPMEPKCKFSRAIVELLNEAKVAFASFDILSDDEVRQGLKTYSNWNTYPQLYYNGVLLGGLDSVKELKGQGPLAEMLAKASSAKQPEKAIQAPTPSMSLDDRLARLTSQAPVMLFMKGSPMEPRCGFSAKIVSILNDAGIAYQTFDILQDEQVRQGLKTFSNWLYVNGKLVGGLDIVQELASEGDLAAELGIQPLNDRLKALTTKSKIMLFMKGSPDAPSCGFSKSIVDILRKENASFESFDILTDEQVRQGLKEYSSWPTYPQLYVSGKLVGGVDIVRELHEDGELAGVLNQPAAL